MLISLLGHRVELDLSLLPEDVALRVEDLWEQCRLSDGEAEETIRILPPDFDGERHNGDLRLSSLTSSFSYELSQALTRRAITSATGELFMFHAAALAPIGIHNEYGERLAVGISAPSGTGKTTFCQRLADSFSYVTDETLAVEPETLRIQSYPKPLSLVRFEDNKRFKEDLTLAEVGLTPVHMHEDTLLSALVLAERVSKGQELIPLPLLEAMSFAIEQSSAFYELSEPLRRLAMLLSLAGGPWLLRFSDQTECADILRSLAMQTLNDEPDAVWWRHLPGLPGPGRHPLQAQTVEVLGDDPEATARYERASWDDGIEAEEGILLLFDRTPVTLAGAGAAVWRALDKPRSFEELHRAVIEQLGEHPESEAIVRGTIADLRAQGLLLLSH